MALMRFPILDRRWRSLLQFPTLKVYARQLIKRSEIRTLATSKGGSCELLPDVSLTMDGSMFNLNQTAAILLFVGSISVVSQSASAQSTVDKIRSTQTIVIGHREASIPFSYFDAQKKPIGYAVELCLSIAEAVKRELKLRRLNIEYVAITSANRIPAIESGKIDLECGSTTNNAERRKQVAFTIPHFVASVKMVVKADSAIKNWPDLSGKTVVTTKGTTTVKLLGDRDKVRALGITLIEGADHNESFNMVETGRAAAFPMDDVLLYGLRASASNPKNLAITGESLSTEPYAIMMRKGDPVFKAIVDKEMARLIYDGTFAKLYAKWFMQPIPPKNINMAMPMSYLLRDLMRYPSDQVADGL